jgi:hypothetical protein
MGRAIDATAAKVLRVESRADSPLATGPFHAALREAIRHRGLTLDRLRSHLARRGVSVAVSTLSDWQHGHRRPGGGNSLGAVRALEDILGLPSESLVRLLIRPVGDEGAAPGVLRPPQGLDERSGALSDLLDSLPGARDRGVVILNREDRALIDADRRAWLRRTRTVVRARRDGVDRFVVRFLGGTHCDIDRVRIHPRENCRLGRVLRHPDPPVLVAELLFDEVLRAGETWVFGEELINPTGDVCTSTGTGFPEPREQYLLEVRFDPRALPVNCHAFARPGMSDEPRRTADLRLNSHHAVHLHVSNVSAGMLGIAWDWEKS